MPIKERSAHEDTHSADSQHPLTSGHNDPVYGDHSVVYVEEDHLPYLTPSNNEDSADIINVRPKPEVRKPIEKPGIVKRFIQSFTQAVKRFFAWAFGGSYKHEKHQEEEVEPLLAPPNSAHPVSDEESTSSSIHDSEHIAAQTAQADRIANGVLPEEQRPNLLRKIIEHERNHQQHHSASRSSSEERDEKGYKNNPFRGYSSSHIDPFRHELPDIDSSSTDFGYMPEWEREDEHFELGAWTTSESHEESKVSPPQKWVGLVEAFKRVLAGTKPSSELKTSSVVAKDKKPEQNEGCAKDIYIKL